MESDKQYQARIRIFSYDNQTGFMGIVENNKGALAQVTDVHLSHKDCLEAINNGEVDGTYKR